MLEADVCNIYNGEPKLNILLYFRVITTWLHFVVLYQCQLRTVEYALQNLSTRNRFKTYRMKHI